MLNSPFDKSKPAPASRINISSRVLMVLFYVLKPVLPLVLDDWLRRERFVFESLNSSFLRVAFAFGVWFIGAIFISSWFRGLALSCLEGCTAITEASTPPNSLGHAILSLWGPEAAGISTFHVVVGFMFHVGLAALLYAIHGAKVIRWSKIVIELIPSVPLILCKQSRLTQWL